MILARIAQRTKKLTTARNQTANSFTYIPINNIGCKNTKKV